MKANAYDAKSRGSHDTRRLARNAARHYAKLTQEIRHLNQPELSSLEGQDLPVPRRLGAASLLSIILFAVRR